MALIIAILFSWLSSVDKMRAHISILFFVINNVVKSLKELVFDPPDWNCWMFWNMVASVGAKYILKYSERLGKQESHLSADRWNLTNKKLPTFLYRLLCFPVGIPYSLQEAIIPFCKRIPLRVAALIKSNFFPCLLRFWYPPTISLFFKYPPQRFCFLRTPPPSPQNILQTPYSLAKLP